ncbi:MAG: InlB B-repeat-containing protein [Clostridia bacterium]|nr:InlB B-repeat-containing protein [Clostridia bacterium]
MKKRIISMLLVLAMMVGMVPVFGITTNAAKQTHYCGAVGTICGEIPYAYRAMKTTYPEDFFITWINMFESYDGSTRDYPYDAEKFNEKIKDSLSSELASHLDPDKINAALFVNCAAGTGSFADAGTAEYDLYDALFLSMLLENASNSEVQDSVFEFINEIISALNTVQEYVINGTTVTSKFIDLIPEIKGTGSSTKISTLLKQVKGFNKISASFDEFFGTCKELGLNSGFDVFVKLIEVLVEVADETTEVVASIEDCILIYRNVGPTYAAVLERIYNNTEDFTIKQIATKYYTLIKSDSWFEVIALSAIEVVNGAVEAGAGVGEIVLKTLIGTTKYGPQYAAVVAALAALDAIIGTKAEIEAAYALICMQKMDEAMANTLTELDSEFKANFNDGKDDLASYCANEYVTAAIMCLRMLQKEYDYCQKFFDAVYDNGLVNKLMNCFPTANKAKFDGWTSHVKTQKEFLKNISEGIFEEGSSLRKQYHSHISLIEKGMKVTYDLNGGSSIEDFAPQTKAYNLHMITRSGTPMREGYVFTGWRPTINGNYINPVDFWYYKDENAISPEINPCYFADEIVLTAQWTEIQNTITYNANGGTGAPASHENTTGNTTLSTTVPTRTGYTFLGWD